MELLKSWIKEAALSYAIRFFTKENLKAVLTAIVAKVKEKAAETENFVDDWAIEFLESIVNSDAKIAILWEHLSVLIGADKNGLILSDVPELGIQSLAEALVYQAEPVREYAGINLVGIVQLLQVVVPILIDWFGRKNETEGTNAA